jgi:hypothetical protein
MAPDEDRELPPPQPGAKAIRAADNRQQSGPENLTAIMLARLAIPALPSDAVIARGFRHEAYPRAPRGAMIFGYDPASGQPETESKTAKKSNSMRSEKEPQRRAHWGSDLLGAGD